MNEVVLASETKRRRDEWWDERRDERQDERRDIQTWDDQAVYKWKKWFRKFESFKSIELRTFKRECIFSLKTEKIIEIFIEIFIDENEEVRRRNADTWFYYWAQ